MEGLCRARLANAGAALDFGDLVEATQTLSPLWRCSMYSDCVLRHYCADKVEKMTDRMHEMGPITFENA